MQKSFYLSKNGSHVGPYTFQEVCKKLESQEHSWVDYIYDDKKEDWILLIEHPLFSEKFNTTFVKPNPQDTSSDDPLKEKAWYTLKNGGNFGPFSQVEIIQMLQEKTLFEYDYLWKHGMPTWRRVSEIEEYSAERIRQLKESGLSEIEEIFFRRRHLRAQYGCSLIVHNNKQVFKGQNFEISAGGAGILLDYTDFNPGQTLFLHFQPGTGVPPFNAICNVVSKRLETTLNNKTPVKYGVKFTSVSQSIREQIREFALNKKVS